MIHQRLRNSNSVACMNRERITLQNLSTDDADNTDQEWGLANDPESMIE